MFARLTAATLLASIPAAVMAQAPTTADENRPVTRTQISERLDTDYANLDADHNGKVDAAEINARLRTSAEADLEMIKKERDATFAKFDADSNGSISKAEFEAHAKLPTIKQPDPKPFLDKFDANKDGAISKDEFRAPTISNFDRLDKNKDGTLSVAEQNGPTAPAKKTTVKDTPPIGR